MDPLRASSGIDSPEALLASDLTPEEKVEALYRWAYDAAEEEVAVEEGMPGDDSHPLQRILLALERLGAHPDVQGVAPSKQHGLPRRSPMPAPRGSSAR